MLTPLMFAAALAGAPAAPPEAAREEALPPREYTLMVGPPDELEPLALAGVGLNKALTDAWYQGIGPHVPGKLGDILGVTWQVFWTFNASVWPHELGHRGRARQTGGAFVIDGYAFPFPKAHMELAEDYDPPELATLSSVAGFEVNALMRRQTIQDLYARDYGYSDELIHAFIQDIYFPLYAFVIAPARATAPETWTDTRGDPVEETLSVYRTWTGREPVGEDGAVDEVLVGMYREAVFVNLATVALDPVVWQEARAFGADMDEDYGLTQPWWIGGERLGWMPSPQMTPTPLGYEVTLHNYLRAGRPWVVSLTAGRPYRDLGLSLAAPALVDTERLTLGAEAHGWSQEVWGSGGAIYGRLDLRLVGGLGLALKGGAKTGGYQVGRRIEAGPLIMGGLSWRHSPPG
jgi:hypothetical protein